MLTVQKPHISLIVAVYKNAEALKLIFQGLEQQSYQDFEVIVAEDNHSPEMAAFIAEQQKKGMFPLKHVYQEDLGFRKNKILNSAICEASGTFCTFIDGDCIPHQHFLKDISKYAREKVVLSGRRVMLSKKISDKICRRQSFKGCMSYIRLVLGHCKHAEKGLYLPFWPVFSHKTKLVFGCNMTISKNDLINVNGFDETYVRPTIGEDVDIVWRLRMSGCDVKFLKYQIIMYHLHHKVNYNIEDSRINDQIFRAKQQKNDWQNRQNGLM